MKKADFAGLGFCSNDFLALLPEIPMDHKVQILEHLVQGGGPAATATVAASRLGMSAAFIGTVGDDEPGKWILRDFQSEGVSTEGMIVRKGHTSAIAYCWIDAPTGKRSVAWTRGTLPELKGEEVDLELVRQAKILHLDGHNPAAALVAAKEARKNDIPVLLDAGTLREGVKELFPYVTILIASESFARQYSGEQDLRKALMKLGGIGATVTGVTMGKEGSLALDGEKILYCPAFPIEPVDTTGAGDVYHAAFAVRYLETQDLMECMRFASAVSALKCLKLGGRAGIPDQAQTEEFLKCNP
ncbi:MAG: carbohydrate kinase family protein [Lentisphaeria bacterium]|nr:carbohydrate kinase family protein [Lentisphaeria bacterium]